VVSDFISGDEPVRNECVVGVIQRCVVGHFYRTPVRIFALGEEHIDGIQGIGLNSIICREHYKLGHVGLWKDMHVSK
jgi:hypothetical protein